MSKKYAMYVGRFQTWHVGHDWLIEQKRKWGIPILLLVRDVERDENNPKSGGEVFLELVDRFARDDDIRIMLIPDVESFNYGRDVGYEVNEWFPPENIKQISGTKIRKQQHICGARGYDPMIDEMCPACKENK